MSVRKVPMRTCVACRANRPKRELVRVVRLPDETLVVDQRGKVSGRGAYLCRDPHCVEVALQQKKLEHALERPLTAALIEELRSLNGVEA